MGQWIDFEREDNLPLIKQDIELMKNTFIQLHILGYARFPLSRVVRLIRGEPISQSTSTPGDIPVIGGGVKPSYYVDRANHEGEIITIAHQGTAGYVGWWDEPIFLAPSCFGLEVNPCILLPRYLYQFIKNQEQRIMGMRYGNTVPAVSWESISQIEVIVPPISKQRKILDNLESFESITNDRCGELTELIEASRKQYECVRDSIFGALEAIGRG